MTQKICMIGGPGSGKSTTTAEVFAAFKKIGHNTEHVPEWIRRDIRVNGVMTNVWEQFRTLIKHREEEDGFPTQVEYAIVDSGCLTPYFYTALYASKDDERQRIVITDMYGYLLDDLYKKRYSHIFFMPRFRTDEAGVSFQDGIRFQTADETKMLEQYMTLMFTGIHKMDNIHILDCPLGERVKTIIETVLGQEGLETWLAALEREK